MAIEEKYTALQLVLVLRDDIKYALCRLQQKMGTTTLEETVARAFREYAERLGVSFATPSLPQNAIRALQDIGFISSPEVPTIRELRGRLIVTLPEFKEGDWNTLRKNSGVESSQQVVALALEEAEKHYCN
jgi:hypothetical protein